MESPKPEITPYVDPAEGKPALVTTLLGADSYGRDIFSRLLFGARFSFTAVPLPPFDG